MGNNIKKFDEYFSLNEGLISWAKKKFKTGELDILVDNIIGEIKDGFVKDNLSVVEKDGNKNVITTFTYKNDKDDVITIIHDINKNAKTLSEYEKYNFLINDDDVTKHINEKYIKKLIKFFNSEMKKKIVKKEIQDDTKEISKIKDKYAKKYEKPWKFGKEAR